MAGSQNLSPLLRLGTRGSPLARAQAHEVKRRLAAAHPALAADGAIEIVIIKTTGDRTGGENPVGDVPLAGIGGKGLFTKEIDDALLNGAIDCAVHSGKDMPSMLPDGIILAAVPERADSRDAFFGKSVKQPADLPQGAVIGTASLRRAAQILHKRPDLKVVPLRGNVETRLRKLAEGQVDATVLAMAGLIRLNLLDARATPLSHDAMLPAVAQGAIAVVCRANDPSTLARLAAISHAASHEAVLAERGFLAALEGSCRTPIAALATCTGTRIALRGHVATPDGKRIESITAEGDRAEAGSVGRKAGLALLERLGASFAQFMIAE